MKIFQPNEQTFRIFFYSLEIHVLFLSVVAFDGPRQSAGKIFHN